MGERWGGGIVADALVDILLRVPPCPRRRLRLVCRHWRDVIDERLPEPQPRAKVLAFVAGAGGSPSRAYVLDGLLQGRAGELGRWGAGVSMVGTYNGVLCLRRRDGDVLLLNPATVDDDALCLPPPLPWPQPCDEAAYSFAYHPATGLYKVVHLPCHRGRPSFDAVSVYTLGGTSWRTVPAPAAPRSSCCLDFGVVSVGGATTGSPWTAGGSCRSTSRTTASPGRHRRPAGIHHRPEQGEDDQEHAHQPREEKTLQGGVVRITAGAPGTAVGAYGGRRLRTFAYVETMEPLGVYGCGGLQIDGSKGWEWKFDCEEKSWKLATFKKWWS
ncbi:hypothetical protein ACP4OV_018051 [Aristida adscensionis]